MGAYGTLRFRKVALDVTDLVTCIRTTIFALRLDCDPWYGSAWHDSYPEVSFSRPGLQFRFLSARLFVTIVSRFLFGGFAVTGSGLFCLAYLFVFPLFLLALGGFDESVGLMELGGDVKGRYLSSTWTYQLLFFILLSLFFFFYLLLLSLTRFRLSLSPSSPG
ncbi:hypothetical protein J3F83DRAFT_162212 [Trichoderma novae-zelandiae]